MSDPCRVLYAYARAKRELALSPGYAWLFAKYEKHLYTNVHRLAQQLRNERWFDGVDVGEPQLWPKRAKHTATGHVSVHIGGTQARSIDELSVRVAVRCSVDFAIVEALWLEEFGPAIQKRLHQACLSYHLDLQQDSSGRYTRLGRRIYEPYSLGFKKFRQAPLRAAADALDANERCVLVATDLKSYYDNLDPSFLLTASFVDDLREQGPGAAFDAPSYQRATASLLAAYRRFWSAVTYWIGGSPHARGLPTGCLTAPFIANVALTNLDRYLAATCDRHWRYVDDIVALSTQNQRQEMSPCDVIRAMFPVARAVEPTTNTFDISLDAALLRASGSVLEITSDKSKVFYLRGVEGKHYLGLVEQDLAKVQSERRWLLAMDQETLAGTGVRVSDGTDVPIHTLREADQIQLERFSSSLAIARLAAVVGLLEPRDRPVMITRHLEHLSRVAKDPSAWTELTGAVFNIVMLCFVAGAREESSRIVGDLLTSWMQIASGQTKLLWNGARLRARRAHTLLDRTLKDQLDDCLLRSADVRSHAWVMPLYRRLRPSLAERTVSRRVRLVANAGLSYLRPTLDSQTRPSVWRGLTVQRSVSSCTPLMDPEDVQEILRSILALPNEIHPLSPLGPVDVLLMARPIEYHEIALQCVRARCREDEVHRHVNALRGTKHLNSGVILHPPESRKWTQTSYDAVLDDFVRYAGPAHDKSRIDHLMALLLRTRAGHPFADPLIIIGNVPTSLVQWKAAAQGTPHHDISRFEALSRVFDAALERRRAYRGPALLLLPELSVPRRWLSLLAARAVKNDMALATGLEYARTGEEVVNEAALVLPSTFGRVVAFSWSKRHPADAEGRDLEALGIRLVAPPWADRERRVVRTPYGDVTTLICSELIESELNAEVFGRANVILVPAWNPDLVSFEHLAHATALRLHAFVCVANNAQYSDCRIVGPHKERWEQDVVRLVDRGAPGCISAQLPLSSLNAFQDGLPGATATGSEAAGAKWKPLPPGFHSRTRPPNDTDW